MIHGEDNNKTHGEGNNKKIHGEDSSKKIHGEDNNKKTLGEDNNKKIHGEDSSKTLGEDNNINKKILTIEEAITTDMLMVIIEKKTITVAAVAVDASSSKLIFML